MKMEEMNEMTEEDRRMNNLYLISFIVETDFAIANTIRFIRDYPDDFALKLSLTGLQYLRKQLVDEIIPYEL